MPPPKDELEEIIRKSSLYNLGIGTLQTRQELALAIRQFLKSKLPKKRTKWVGFITEEMMEFAERENREIDIYNKILDDIKKEIGVSDDPTQR